jgi:hypothetical protein
MGADSRTTETLRKFDGKPVQLDPTTLLCHEDGQPAADIEWGDAILAFATPELAKAFLPLAKQKATLRPVEVGYPKIRELLQAHPAIPAVAVVVDLGPLSWDAHRKRQRPVYKVYVKRAVCLTDGGRTDAE